MSQMETFKIGLPITAMSSGAATTAAFSDIDFPLLRFGNSYLISGNKTLSSRLAISDVQKYSMSIALDAAMRSVSVMKDVNDDGYDDLIIGDPYAAKCYILFGKSDGLMNMNKGFTIFGESEGDLTGWSVSGAGDVNNDTIADIIIGAPFANKVGGFYVIYGRSRNNVDVYLNNLTTSQGFAMYGAQKSDYLGISVSNAGDVNKDGYDDVIVGVVKTGAYFAGGAFVLFGGSHLSTLTSISNLTPLRGFQVTSSVSFSYIGCSVSGAGDVNNDGYDDVLIGSNPQKSSWMSTTYLIFGSKVVEEIVLSQLTSSQGVAVVGGGMFVSSVGDVNGDGYDDVLISEGSVASNGIIVLTDISDFHLENPPTLKPSTIPSLTPSLAPTLKPSKSPTLVPTRVPSVVPSTRQTVPSFEPTTLAPGASLMPSVEPSLTPTETPTFEPTAEPSESPSVRPSQSPTVEPSSIEPSWSPSQQPIKSTDIPTLGSTMKPTGSSRVPIGIPTLSPTLLPTAGVVSVDIKTDGHAQVFNYSTLVGDYRYVVNTTGNVQIDAPKGKCIYYIVPSKNTTLTIWKFNVSSDIIDVTLFKSLRKLTDLTIQSGSIIIILPHEQIIHIMNLEPSDISELNFIFSTSKFHESVVKSVIFALQLAIPCSLGIIIAYYIYYRRDLKQQEEKSKENIQRLVVKYADHHLLYVVTTHKGDFIYNEYGNSINNSINSSMDSCRSMEFNEADSISDDSSMAQSLIDFVVPIDSSSSSCFSSIDSSDTSEDDN